MRLQFIISLPVTFYHCTTYILLLFILFREAFISLYTVRYIFSLWTCRPGISHRFGGRSFCLHAETQGWGCIISSTFLPSRNLYSLIIHIIPRSSYITIYCTIYIFSVNLSTGHLPPFWRWKFLSSRGNTRMRLHHILNIFIIAQPIFFNYSYYSEKVLYHSILYTIYIF